MAATAISPIRHALISVSDKSGLIDLGRRLETRGVTLFSTGGSAQTLRKAGIAVTDVSELTGFPEIMDGRVKTLHPKIHAALLGRRDTDHAVMTRQDITPIDLLVINFYPFETTLTLSDCTPEKAIEQIDIGGPAMMRSAAKNWNDVGVLCAPKQYTDALNEIEQHGGLLRATRFRLAVTAFNHVARYDGAISNYFSGLQFEGPLTTTTGHATFPAQFNQHFEKVMDLRYGENPHQQAAFYLDLAPATGTPTRFESYQGKALSFNNMIDVDTALACVHSFVKPACVIVKHANPCGAAIHPDGIGEAYELAWQADSTSAFGGIIAFNRVLDETTAQAILARQFVEVMVAPGYEGGTLEMLRSKRHLRVLQLPQGAGSTSQPYLGGMMDVRRVGSGLLIQQSDTGMIDAADLHVVTRRAPSPAQIDDLIFAWKVAKFVKSNAIVYARHGQTLGIGAGQMSRIDSVKIAGMKASDGKKQDICGAVMASDAFFPFRDSIDMAASIGIQAIIQPGGSRRDTEVINAADEHGMAMVYTGMRHFRH